MLPAIPNVEIVECTFPKSVGLLDLQRQSQLGQYFTPANIASFMASCFGESNFKDIRLLDPGAGLGALSVAFIESLFPNKSKNSIDICAYEIDPFLFQSEPKFREISWHYFI